MSVEDTRLWTGRDERHPSTATATKMTATAREVLQLGALPLTSPWDGMKRDLFAGGKFKREQMDTCTVDKRAGCILRHSTYRTPSTRGIDSMDEHYLGKHRWEAGERK